MGGDMTHKSLSDAVLKEGKHGADYGSAPSKKEKEGKAFKMPIIGVLGACLFLPVLLFMLTFWLKSFEMRYQSGDTVEVITYGLLLVPAIFAFMAYSLWNSQLDAKPMALLLLMTLTAWTMGLALGDNNYHLFMQPYYDISSMTTFPSVDPSLYNGQQLMDAGQIRFTPGSHLDITKSMGFVDGETFCVAPVVTNASGHANGTQITYDFWAVGMNCCSGHLPDFHCGEYSNPKATNGLRLMDGDKRDMFHLVVQKASAEFNLKVAHPMFMYWLADPDTELQAYQDDGYGHFITASFCFFCACLVVVVCAVVALPKL